MRSQTHPHNCSQNFRQDGHGRLPVNAAVALINVRGNDAGEKKLNSAGGHGFMRGKPAEEHERRYEQNSSDAAGADDEADEYGGQAEQYEHGLKL